MAVSWSSGVLALVLLLPSYLVIQNFVGLAKNYSDARKIGCPRRVIPISPLNPLWMLVDDRILAYVRRLPFGLGNNSFTRYNWRGWEVRDRYHSHKEMGDIWILVTPYRNWVMINDPETIVHVNKRLTEFPRPGFVTDVLAVFGPNVGNASGESWKMQRRLVTRCLNEKNNQIVWSESISLSAEMLSYWESKPSVAHTDRDVRTLTLHVLSRALFGRSFRFEGDDEKQATRLEKTMDYREALGIILSNLLLIVGFGGPRVFRSLPKLGIPKKLHTIRTALDTFGAYMVNTYDDTKARHAKQEKLDANFMAMIVQASQDEASEKGGLNEAEVYGNMFAVSFAGHDTTALTFTFAMYFLAAHPEVQDWVFEEIQAVLGSRDVTELDYRADFHRLKRCLAIMFESLRLYDIVPTIKWTGDHTRQITVRGKAYTLPPETMVLPHYGSLMTDPKYWGDASLDWKPSRWIKTAEGSSPKPGDEDFIAYTRGTFVPWGEGTIDCPGRKFAHVEFVATLAVLLSKHRVEPLKQKGETDQQARERVMDLIENDSAPGLLLQMQHPERAPLVWKQR